MIRREPLSKVVLRQCPKCGEQVDPKTLDKELVMMPAEMLATLEAENAELRALRDGYDPNERVPELGQKILVYYGGDFALYTCFDENRLVNSRGYRINADYPDRWWPLSAGKVGE